MSRAPVLIAAASAEAPAWVLASPTMPDQQLRERGAAELARRIAGRLEAPPPVDARQLALPLRA